MSEMSPLSAILRALCLSIFGFLLGCPDRSGPCQADDDCGAGQVCREAVCRCAVDEGCPTGQRCNREGSCQAPPACRSNLDCSGDTRCDLGEGRCIASEGCVRTLDCALGELCEEGRCVPGCASDADCPLGRLCQEGLRCELGCRDAAGCPLGESCVGEACFAGTLPGLCLPCGGGADCSGREDWCLVNRGFVRGRPETGAERECAPDCMGAREICPNGTTCRAITVRVTPPCTGDASCPGARQCEIVEGDPVGRCTCLRDADCLERLPPFCTRLGFCEAPAGRLCGSDLDCESVRACGPYGAGGTSVCYLDRSQACTRPQDCLCLNGRCTLTGRECQDATDCPIACEGGGCVVGAGCTPDEGVSCRQLR